MTKAQRRNHKIGNQLRKKRIILNARRAPKGMKQAWVDLGAVQDGKWTRSANQIVK